tara:strand:- start:139 stop:321 length:183 start_codon:yes stop_codon:yes gene_type:complete
LSQASTIGLNQYSAGKSDQPTLAPSKTLSSGGHKEVPPPFSSFGVVMQKHAYLKVRLALN